jgi:hypothetical protein
MAFFFDTTKVADAFNLHGLVDTGSLADLVSSADDFGTQIATTTFNQHASQADFDVLSDMLIKLCERAAVNCRT